MRSFDYASRMSRDTASYPSSSCSSAQTLRNSNQGGYEGYSISRDLPRAPLPIFEGEHDPKAYLDWEWQCERFFKAYNISEVEQATYAMKHIQRQALRWWELAKESTKTWSALKRFRKSYVPKEYMKLYNVNPRRQVGTRKIDIC